MRGGGKVILRTLLQAIPTMLGILLLSSVAVIVTNMVIDWLITLLDPRIRA